MLSANNSKTFEELVKSVISVQYYLQDGILLVIENRYSIHYVLQSSQMEELRGYSGQGFVSNFSSLDYIHEPTDFLDVE